MAKTKSDSLKSTSTPFVPDLGKGSFLGSVVRVYETKSFHDAKFDAGTPSNAFHYRGLMLTPTFHDARSIQLETAMREVAKRTNAFAK